MNKQKKIEIFKKTLLDDDLRLVEYLNVQDIMETLKLVIAHQNGELTTIKNDDYDAIQNAADRVVKLSLTKVTLKSEFDKAMELSENDALDMYIEMYYKTTLYNNLTVYRRKQYLEIEINDVLLDVTLDKNIDEDIFDQIDDVLEGAHVSDKHISMLNDMLDEVDESEIVNIVYSIITNQIEMIADLESDPVGDLLCDVEISGRINGEMIDTLSDTINSHDELINEFIDSVMDDNCDLRRINDKIYRI